VTRRKSIYLEGFTHANPIPVASVIGPFLYSGAITGKNLSTGLMPSTLDEQCAVIFERVRQVMAMAGGSTDDIIKMSFDLAEYRNRDALNREWLAMFPDPLSRPARQARSAVLDGGALIHCEIVAVLSSPSK
jgi:enamine deaminase RidA (YjgF/YER057c/UK114 family)